jgi:hypothetical protein
MCRIVLTACVLMIFVFVGHMCAQTQPADVARLLEGRDIFYDDLGLIVHKDPGGTPNGGDTAQREGWYWLGVWLRQNTPGLQPWTPKRTLTFEQVLRLLEPNRDGVFYRHPTQPPYNNPRGKEFGFSRDQMEPLVAAMGVFGKYDELRRLWNALPEDQLGKHSFNGNWRSLLGHDGQDCSAIKARGCDAQGDCSLKIDSRDCSLKVDTRSCSLQTDNRDCSLKVDTRSCSLQTDNRDCSLKVDTRNCGYDVGPFHFNDPFCEAAKAAQNAIYAAEKAACEAAKAAQNVAYKLAKDKCEADKAAQNVIYASEKAACEAAKAAQNVAYKLAKDKCEADKAAQNVIYATEKAACESAKASQNAIYAGEKAACETAKTAVKVACEVQKEADYRLCRLGNVHSGDVIGPMTVNLFRRALGQNPLLPSWEDLQNLLLPLPYRTVIEGGFTGELELLANAHLRVHDAEKNADDVGDDLNLIVKLLMTRLRYATPISDEALSVYALQRPHSYGSYLGAYYAKFGDDMTDLDNRVKAGIADGWSPDVSASIGAVRWYHRPNAGANPQLAQLYRDIIATYIDRMAPGDSGNPAPPPPSFAASPNPITLASGVTSGKTTLIWSAPGYDRLVIRVGVPPKDMTGDLQSSGFTETGTWVTDGTQFMLVNARNGATVATTTVNVTGGVSSSATTPVAFAASPNPITPASGSTSGKTTLTWNAPGYNRLRIRVGVPAKDMTGDLPSTGSAETGTWVMDGTPFMLVNAENGVTLATLTIQVNQNLPSSQPVGACQLYKPPAFRGMVLPLAFINVSQSRTLKVQLFHPQAPNVVFATVEVPPGANTFISRAGIGDDWGIRVDSGCTASVGEVATFYTGKNWQAKGDATGLVLIPGKVN